MSKTIERPEIVQRTDCILAETGKQDHLQTSAYPGYRHSPG